MKTTPNTTAYFIGIDNYQFASTSLPNLDKPLKDATALQHVLLDKYSLTTENSTLLKNPTRTEVLSALEELSQKVTAKDNLLVFYAGHGVWDERLKVGYWLPSDAKISSKGNWLSNSTVRDYIAGIDTKHTLLITDACFSGSIFKTRGVNADISGYGISKIYKLPSRKAMTSGTLTTVPDESKFMHYLIKRLEENTSKYLTTRQLFFSLETAVLNNTSTVPQLGVIQDTGDEGGDFVFIKRGIVLYCWYCLVPPQGGARGGYLIPPTLLISTLRRKIIPYNPKLKPLAKKLRKNMPLAEVLLWNELKGKQVLGYDFDRQRPIDNYIVDFYCKALFLAIEVDGDSHYHDDAPVKDAIRQKKLESLGVHFLRFHDIDVKKNISNVVNTIYDWVKEHSESKKNTHP